MDASQLLAIDINATDTADFNLDSGIAVAQKRLQTSQVENRGLQTKIPGRDPTSLADTGNQNSGDIPGN